MNKYQEVLNRLKNKTNKPIFEYYKDEQGLNRSRIKGYENEDCYLLQELVDKETPMKPIVTIVFPLCPRCHRESVRSNDYGAVKYNRCTECGQKIDWSI